MTFLTFCRLNVLDPNRRLHAMTIIEDIINCRTPYELSVSLAEFVKLCHVPLYTFLWPTLIEDNVNSLIENWNFRINCHTWLTRLAKFSYPLFYVDGSSLALYMVLRDLFLKETLTMYILFQWVVLIIPSIGSTKMCNC